MLQHKMYSWWRTVSLLLYIYMTSSKYEYYDIVPSASLTTVFLFIFRCTYNNWIEYVE